MGYGLNGTVDDENGSVDPLESIDYEHWIKLPESEVRKHIIHIATYHSLDEASAKYLEWQMLFQAGHNISHRKRYGPWKMDGSIEEKARKLSDNDEDIFHQNALMNAPQVPTIYPNIEENYSIIGSGLTRRYVDNNEPSELQLIDRARSQKHIARKPFSMLNSSIRFIADKALWRANCVPISHETWLVRGPENKPREGAWWYKTELDQAYQNALRQAELGNVEGALWHAFRAGEFYTELQMRHVHGKTFEKYEAVSVAQSEAGSRRARATPDAKKEVYLRIRAILPATISNTEVARRAGAELGYSGATQIVRAFGRRGLPNKN